MSLHDWLRYGIWTAVGATANANRREYHMQTTWLPHLVTNTLTLLLPDLLRLLVPKNKQPSNIVGQLAVRMIRDNDNYVIYVIPLAAGYLLSHPRFNIFKGELAEISLLGLRLDAIPHGATGFALTASVCDTLDIAAQLGETPNRLSHLVKRMSRHPAAISFGLLATLTFIWEFGEYRVHKHELALRGDITKINMMWSVEDTARDVAANFLGWVGALILRRSQRKR